MALSPIVLFAVRVVYRRLGWCLEWRRGDFPFLRMEIVIAPLHLGGYNDTYVGEALPQFETNLQLFFDGTPERMINVVEH